MAFTLLVGLQGARHQSIVVCSFLGKVSSGSVTPFPVELIMHAVHWLIYVIQCEFAMLVVTDKTHRGRV